MSREVAGTSPPLLSELFNSGIYKPSQGRLVRQLTCLAIWIMFALGCWRLSVFLSGSFGDARWAEVAVPFGVFLALAWVGFRLVNWPKFADFLIAVEAEMAKVSWPSRTELVRASIVVIFTIFFLAVTLFMFDVIWELLFKTLGVTA